MDIKFYQSNRQINSFYWVNSANFHQMTWIWLLLITVIWLCFCFSNCFRSFTILRRWTCLIRYYTIQKGNKLLPFLTTMELSPQSLQIQIKHTWAERSSFCSYISLLWSLSDISIQRKSVEYNYNLISLNLFIFLSFSLIKSDESYIKGHIKAFSHRHRQWKVHRQGTLKKKGKTAK